MEFDELDDSILRILRSDEIEEINEDPTVKENESTEGNSDFKEKFEVNSLDYLRKLHKTFSQTNNTNVKSNEPLDK